MKSRNQSHLFFWFLWPSWMIMACGLAWPMNALQVCAGLVLLVLFLTVMLSHER